MEKRDEKVIKPKPTLAWTKADFLSNSVEVPEYLVEDDLHTEGELMTIEEIADWVHDTEKVFHILSQENTELFEKLYNQYIVDIHYLVELGKISAQDEVELLDKKRFLDK